MIIIINLTRKILEELIRTINYIAITEIGITTGETKMTDVTAIGIIDEIVIATVTIVVETTKIREDARGVPRGLDQDLDPVTDDEYLYYLFTFSLSLKCVN